jgi:mannose/cellobiose epimerase-like protein (N-acyl-D-glucosamine 2-epimerase family)
MPVRAIARFVKIRRPLRSPWLMPSVDLRAAAPGGAQLSPPRSLAEARTVLQRILIQSMLPFWLHGTLDPAGGYRLHHDVHGRWRGGAGKRLVSQARMVWFLARLMECGHGVPEVAALARHGLALLAERFWDRRHGGFFWELDAAGGQATMADKHAYGQAQALYAVSQYALATRCSAALDLARATFRVLDERCHDRQYGGYHEFFRSDWAPAPTGRRGYLGAPPALKLANTHLHLLEAVSVFLRLTGDGRAHERLEELVDLFGGALLHPVHATLAEPHERDWSQVDRGRAQAASYGHDVEAIHLLIAADEALGRPADGRLSLYRRVFDHAVRCGADLAGGGFWSSGPPGQPASDRRKIWWVQAEALLTSLELHRLTGEESFLEVFLHTLAWVQRWQVDWSGGDWHAEVVRGRAYGLKAGPWKGPYHNGRAVLHSLAILDRMIDAPKA